MTVVTYQDVKAHLNLTDDSDAYELQSFIDAAVGIVEQEIGPVQPTSYTETQYVTGYSTLILNHPPVQSVQSVTEYVWNVGQTLTAQPFGTVSPTPLAYSLDAEAGLLRRYMSGYPTAFMGPVVVTYTAGRDIVPPAVRRAVLVIVAHLWQTQRGTSSLPSLGGEAPAPVGVGSGIPPLARELLKGYDNRIPTVA
jgi:uncharacterized phiE125 gp8 family phage protein